MDAIKRQRQQEDLAPVVSAFSMHKDAKNGWVFVQYEIKNGKVINETMKECMDKDHAIEVYKLAFVNTFIDGK